jgi:hypothetical protein
MQLQWRPPTSDPGHDSTKNLYTRCLVVAERRSAES